MRLRATLAADLVDALLSAQLALVVLATNREPLDVDGEHVLRLARSAACRCRAIPGAARRPGFRRVERKRERDRGARIYSLVEIAAQVRADATLNRVGRVRGGNHHRTVRDAVHTSYRDLQARGRTRKRKGSASAGPPPDHGGVNCLGS